MPTPKKKSSRPRKDRVEIARDVAAVKDLLTADELKILKAAVLREGRTRSKIRTRVKAKKAAKKTAQRATESKAAKKAMKSPALKKPASKKTAFKDMPSVKKATYKKKKADEKARIAKRKASLKALGKPFKAKPLSAKAKALVRKQKTGRHNLTKKEMDFLKKEINKRDKGVPVF